jgi:apolipoprotein D and lipocalin family protein
MNELKAIKHVDLDRFMGAWYVIAHIPPFLTRNAYNAVERYSLDEDGRVQVVFTYRDGGFDGDQKTLTPTGFPDQGDADGEWGMRLIWPFKADYRIVHLDDQYSETIVGRNKRDYVWIMARSPSMDATRYGKLVDKVGEMGYDTSKLREVPQQPLDERDDE